MKYVTAAWNWTVDKARALNPFGVVGDFTARELVTPSGGKGPSITKLMYYRICTWMLICIVLLVAATIAVYVWKQILAKDMMYLITGMTTVLVGFATHSHNRSKTLNAQFNTEALNACLPTADSDTHVEQS